MDWSILIPVAVSVIGAVVSIYSARLQRRKLEAEANQLEAQGNSALVASSITLHEPLRAEINILRKEIEAERTARKRDADDCKAAINAIGQQKDKQIGLLQAEVTVLRNQISNLKGQNTQLRARVTELERKPTGELNTPGPHTIPDSTFVDPPPSEEAPEDWD